MRIFNVPIWKDTNVFHVSDNHIGSLCRKDALWDKLINMVHSSIDGLSTQRNIVIDYGDFMEGITSDDPRWDKYSTRLEYLDEQMDAAEEDYYGPIKNHIVGIAEGNHTWKLRKLGLFTPRLCRKLGKNRYTDENQVPFPLSTKKQVTGINYLGIQGILNYMVKGEIIIPHRYMHGRSGLNATLTSKRKGDKAVDENLQDKLRNKFIGKLIEGGLLYTTAHNHKLVIAPPLTKRVRTVEKGLLGQKNKVIDPAWYVSTGSFYTSENVGFDSYGEFAEYDPVRTGFAVMKIRDKRIVGVEKVR